MTQPEPRRPTMTDVLEARAVVQRYLPRTPLHPCPALAELLGAAEVRLKHEDHHALGAFKVRGGVNLAAHLSPEERRRGMVTASTGNHGQSIAYAGRLTGVPVTVYVPRGANPLKAAAMRRLGAEVVEHGAIFEDAREEAERVAREEGMRYVHPCNEPLLIAGVATSTLEVLEEFPQVDAIVLPAGAGTGASGACIVAKTLRPQVQVFAVQSEQAPAAYLSWREGRIVEAPVRTFAEGIATRIGYELPQSILRDLLDDFVLVSDEEIKAAVGLLLEQAHTLAEGAGAAALAGALRLRPRLAGRNVVIVVSGANITVETLQECLAVYLARREG